MGIVSKSVQARCLLIKKNTSSTNSMAYLFIYGVHIQLTTRLENWEKKCLSQQVTVIMKIVSYHQHQEECNRLNR